MKRRLALFFDGTWNRRSSETNVSRLYELAASQRKFRKLLGRKIREEVQEGQPKVQQLTYYHQGVGVKWGEKVWGGAFGYGLSRNIKDGYLWLSQFYQPGDEIFICGFSRGAYTARSLIGLIRKRGIPRTPNEALIKEAYQIYREKKWHPDGREAVAFKYTFSYTDTPIKFIGVWDTVGALGIPAHGIWFGKEYYSWHDTDLSKMVQNAYHAVAMDEHRPDFAATMWSKAKKPKKGQRVEQRWFPGSHADVGAGTAMEPCNRFRFDGCRRKLPDADWNSHRLFTLTMMPTWARCTIRSDRLHLASTQCSPGFIHTTVPASLA